MSPAASTASANTTGPVLVYVDNRAQPDRSAQVAAVVADIRARIRDLDIAMTGRRDDAQIVVSLVRDRDLAHAIRTLYGIDRARRIQRSLEPQCLSGFRKDENSRILHSDVLIVADAGEFVFYDCIYEELLQSLGPINDDTTVPWTMFNDDVQMGFFDLYDQYLLNILYDRRIRPGMTRAQVEALLPEVLPQVRAWVDGNNSAKPSDVQPISAVANGSRQLTPDRTLRAAECDSTLRERLDLQARRQRVELLDQRRRQLHAVGAAVGAALAAIRARQPDRIEARQGRRRGQVLEMPVHLGGENLRRNEARHVERDDELPGVGRRRCRAPTDRRPRGRTPRR